MNFVQEIVLNQNTIIVAPGQGQTSWSKSCSNWESRRSSILAKDKPEVIRPMIKNIMKKILVIAILYQNTIWIILVMVIVTRKLRTHDKTKSEISKVIDLNQE